MEELLKDGTLTTRQRLLDLEEPHLIRFNSSQVEVAITSLLLVLAQDGGNFSSMMGNTLLISTITE
jgi:hypothetical protein